MATTSILGGGDHNVTVYGNGSVSAGDGNNAISLGSGTISAGDGNNAINVGGSGNVVLGNGQDTVVVAGNGIVTAGNGNNDIRILGLTGQLSVGSGSNNLALNGAGTITQMGASGHDTINIGTGDVVIAVQGTATVAASNLGQSQPFGGVSGTLGSATISGGAMQITHLVGVNEQIALSGRATLLGGTAATQFIGGSGTTLMTGGSGHDTFIGGSGQDTMTAIGSQNTFEFRAGGNHVINNFVSTDQLFVGSQSLSALTAAHDVTVQNGNTYISVDGGKTTIELHGITQTVATGHGLTQDPLAAASLLNLSKH